MKDDDSWWKSKSRAWLRLTEAYPVCDSVSNLVTMGKYQWKLWKTFGSDILDSFVWEHVFQSTRHLHSQSGYKFVDCRSLNHNKIKNGCKGKALIVLLNLFHATKTTAWYWYWTDFFYSVLATVHFLFAVYKAKKRTWCFYQYKHW